MCPAKAARRASPRCSSCRRTRRRSGRARAPSRPTSRSRAHLQDYPDGSATELREAIGRAFGLDPDRIVCGAGSDDLVESAGARLSRRRRRGDPHHARLSRLSDRDARHRRDAGGRAGDRLHRRASTRSSPRVTEKTKIVFLANPNNPTGTYVSVRRGQAAASQPAAARAARARRRLCRICPAQRLRIRHRARRHAARTSS